MGDYWHDLPNNYSSGKKVSGFGSWFDYANYSTDNTMVIGILVSIFVIVFFSLRGNSNKSSSMATALVIVSAFAIMFARITTINGPFMWFLIILTVAAVIWAATDRNPYY